MKYTIKHVLFLMLFISNVSIAQNTSQKNGNKENSVVFDNYVKKAIQDWILAISLTKRRVTLTRLRM